VDKNAIIIAISPPLTAKAKSAIGINISDRSFITVLQKTLKPMISDVVMGKIGEMLPRLLVLAPVVIDGRYAGHVSGALDLRQIREHLDNSLASNATLYTLLDGSGNIIMTNRTDQAMMKPFVRPKGALNRLDDQISQWVPSVPANTPISERWRQSFYIAESSLGSMAGWKLILEQPMAPFQKTLHHNYTHKLFLLFVILLVSLVLAEFLSRSMNVTFENLGRITHGLPRQVSNDDREIAWPESSIREAAHLISNFKLMSESLAEQFSKIRQVNQSLEQLLGELRESEERFSCMFRKHSAVMLLIEPETGAIVDANLAAESFYEYPRQTLLGMNLDDINTLPSDLVKAAKNSVNASKDFFILPHRKASGEIRTVEVRSTPISVNGKIQLFSIINDITERMQAEEERNSLQAQLQQVQKMEAIGTLAGGIAHDFNNILGALLGYAEIALEDCPPGSLVSNEIEQILKAGKRARDLVKQILAFSRQAQTERMPLQPSVMVKETVKMLSSTLPATIEIKQDIDPDAGPILADPTQIHQILMNLCTNAYQAMEEHGGMLTISLKMKDLTEKDLETEPRLQPGPFVHLSIKDTGEGIAPEIRDRIFDPYFTTKEIGKGSGMGLAILHGIVKSYNGFVTCRSTLGEGSVFDVFLPRIADEAVPEITSAVPIQGGDEHILLVDDESMLVEMGHKMLERLGYHVTSMTGSVEALRAFQDQPQVFDLVITDQTMPVMTGSDLARHMLQIRPDLPIILCTGYSNHISEEKARALGIQGFAMKPLVRKEIAVLIRRVLDTAVI